MSFDFRDYRNDIERAIDNKVDDIVNNLNYAVRDCFCYFSDEFEEILEEAYQQGYEHAHEESTFSLWNWMKEYANSPRPKDLKEILNTYDPENLDVKELERLLEEANKEEKVVFKLGDEVLLRDQVCVVVNDNPDHIVVLDSNGEFEDFYKCMNPEVELKKTGGTYPEIAEVMSRLYENEMGYRTMV